MTDTLFRILRNICLGLMLFFVITGALSRLAGSLGDGSLANKIIYHDNPETVARAIHLELPTPAQPLLRKQTLETNFHNRTYNWQSARQNFESRWLLPRKWVQEGRHELTELSRQVMGELSLQMTYTEFGALTQREQNVLFWQEVYTRAVQKNRPRLKNMIRAFRHLQKEAGLSRVQAAKLALHFVQSIPYKQPGGELDLLTPQDALVRRFGDCDTKSLMLILILRGLGVDANMLISYHYKHAMVGIALPSPGDAIEQNGRSYYFSETTAPGHTIGSLPAKVGEKQYWDALSITAN